MLDCLVKKAILDVLPRHPTTILSGQRIIFAEVVGARGSSRLLWRRST